MGGKCSGALVVHSDGVPGSRLWVRSWGVALQFIAAVRSAEIVVEEVGSSPMRIWATLKTSKEQQVRNRRLMRVAAMLQAHSRATTEAEVIPKSVLSESDEPPWDAFPLLARTTIVADGTCARASLELVKAGQDYVGKFNTITLLEGQSARPAQYQDVATIHLSRVKLVLRTSLLDASQSRESVAVKERGVSCIPETI